MIKNVLIVDDDQEMLAALENGFTKYGDTFVVITAEDGQVAIEKLKKNTGRFLVYSGNHEISLTFVES